jgi:ATP-binding cassette subfamily B protein
MTCNFATRNGARRAHGLEHLQFLQFSIPFSDQLESSQMPGLAETLRALQEGPETLTKKIKPGTLRRALTFATPHAQPLLVFVAVVIVDAAVGVANPLIYRLIINDGILAGNVALIVRLALLVAGIGVIDATLGLCHTWLATRIGAAIAVSLRTRLFEHVQRMPMAFFQSARTGALVSRLAGDVSGARSAFTDILSNVIGNSVKIVLIIAALAAVSWRLMLAALLLALVLTAPAHYRAKRIKTTVRENLNLNAAINSTMVERFNVAGALLNKLFGNPTEEARSFEKQSWELSHVAVKSALHERMFSTILLLMTSFATALAYGWGGVLAAHHELDLGTVVAFSTLLGRLYAPVVGLSNVQVNVQTVLVSFERVFEILDFTPSIKNKPNAMAIPAGPIRLSFEHVSFRYPSASEVSLPSLESVSVPEKCAPATVLHDIDFTIERGQLVALVGPSGAGKTTIAQLISRLYDVQTGTVRINGVDVRDATLESLQKRIGFVTQHAHLFHETLRTNMKYAEPNASEEEIRAALREAQILDLVDSLPDGLDTRVGERGYRFSGGEKQRLAIARVLLRSPDLVILDEATSNLDSASEAAIQQALERAFMDRTAVVIAHRLSTVLKADLILVVKNGRIVQRGTHQQLAAQPGLYAQLYQKQFFGQDRVTA